MRDCHDLLLSVVCEVAPALQAPFRKARASDIARRQVGPPSSDAAINLHRVGVACSAFVRSVATIPR